MRQWSQEPTAEPSADSEGDVFNVLWEATARYYGTNPYGIRPDYERVLDVMSALASWLSPRPFGNPIIESIGGHTPLGALEWLRDSSDEFASRKLVLSQQAFLLEKLANYMRRLCASLNCGSSEFSSYLHFSRELRGCFELGIYNLNYDSLARTAWPEAYCGFDRYGNFDPLGVTQRLDWGFIYHLHGSVHHCIRRRPPRIEWQDDLSSEFVDRHDTVIDMAQDFRSIPLTTCIAGGSKLSQLLADPYQTFYAALVRHVKEADAFLIAGYGFGDPHVNRVLRNRFEERDYDNRPRPRVVILEKSCPRRSRTARQVINEFWSWEVKHTFQTTFSDGSGWPSEDDRTVAEFIEQGKFETDIKNRVAIWHGGFSAACSAAHAITEMLS